MLYLVQTDTTAGFLSKDFREINKAKNRDLQTPCILAMARFSELLNFVRVPKAHKNLVRKAKKTSFVYEKSSLKKALQILNDEFATEFDDLASFKGENSLNLSENFTILNENSLILGEKNLACRVVKGCAHSEFLAKNGAFFSSSANLHGKNFDPQKARQIALSNGGKIIDETLFTAKASALIRLFKTKKRKIR